MNCLLISPAERRGSPSWFLPPLSTTAPPVPNGNGHFRHDTPAERSSGSPGVGVYLWLAGSLQAAMAAAYPVPVQTIDRPEEKGKK